VSAKVHTLLQLGGNKRETKTEGPEGCGTEEDAKKSTHQECIMRYREGGDAKRE